MAQWGGLHAQVTPVAGGELGHGLLCPSFSRACFLSSPLTVGRLSVPGPLPKVPSLRRLVGACDWHVQGKGGAPLGRASLRRAVLFCSACSSSCIL